MELNVLLGPAAEDLAQLYQPPPGRWVRAAMVTTVDGSVTGADGLSKSIANDVDQQVFRLLRETSDAIVVGAGTARAEGYQPNQKPLFVVSRSEEMPPTLRDSSAELISDPDGVDLPALLDTLAARGLERVVIEGGPHLLADAFAAGVIDELSLNLVPHLVGGEHKRITVGTPLDVPLRLVGLVEVEGTLLGRWQPA